MLKPQRFLGTFVPCLVAVATAAAVVGALRPAVEAAAYDYSGGFFFDNVGTSTRTRRLSEIQDPGHVLPLLNSRTAYPDLGPWMMSARCDLNGNQVAGSSPYGPFVGHEGKIAVAMADGHAVAEKLINTIQPVDQWRSADPNYSTQAKLLVIAASMADEYK